MDELRTLERMIRMFRRIEKMLAKYGVKFFIYQCAYSYDCEARDCPDPLECEIWVSTNEIIFTFGETGSQTQVKYDGEKENWVLQISENTPIRYPELLKQLKALKIVPKKLGQEGSHKRLPEKTALHLIRFFATGKVKVPAAPRRRNRQRTPRQAAFGLQIL